MAAPKFENLPKRLSRGALCETEDRKELKVKLRVVTPILGGAPLTRSIDEVDVIRVPTIRGHLRFWWRALFADGLTGATLAAAEKAFWGGATDTDDGQGGRSPVEVRVTVHNAPQPDNRNVGINVRGFYALWPARGAQGAPSAPRRPPGTVFTLTMSAPKGSHAQLRATLQAWILFGGYGGRTRRGCGSLSVEGVELRGEWLPKGANSGMLTALLRGGTPGPARDIASLRGARLVLGAATTAEGAWEIALDWLKGFRQGHPAAGLAPAHDPAFARESGADGTRPGRSNWPEADKIRHLARLPSGAARWQHPPLHNATPAFPRAGFGLPILGQFQSKDRKDNYYPGPEPSKYEIKWRTTGQHGEDKNRLASPVIVKALALSDGQFAPCALWLHRAFPVGEVFVLGGGIRPFGAPFDQLVAARDTARFDPLATASAQPAGKRLQTAFLEWLKAKPGVAEVP